MLLKCAFSPNPRIQPLVDGEVTIEGVETDWTFDNPGRLHLHHLTQDTFDVFEFSISNYLVVQDNLATAHVRWKAIPIFLSKALMWTRTYVRDGSGIESLSDLRGKRFGIPDFHMTAGVWMRIVLRHLYGIRPEDIQWFNGRPPEFSHGENVGGSLAPGISLTRLQESGAMNRMLHTGEIDAAYDGGPSVEVTAGSDVHPLFTSTSRRQVIEDFRRKTGQTPVNHVLMVQERLLEQDPTLAVRLYEAFEQSKQAAYKKARKAASGYALFPDEDVARQVDVFGEDPFPSGVAANRDMLEMVFDEACGEGLLRKRPVLESLFADTVRGT